MYAYYIIKILLSDLESWTKSGKIIELEEKLSKSKTLTENKEVQKHRQYIIISKAVRLGLRVLD
jgi:hypothetical protein